LNRAANTGNVTDTNVVWLRGGANFYRTISTRTANAAIIYISNLSGFLHALNVETGERI